MAPEVTAGKAGTRQIEVFLVILNVVAVICLPIAAYLWNRIDGVKEEVAQIHATDARQDYAIDKMSQGVDDMRVLLRQIRDNQLGKGELR